MIWVNLDEDTKKYTIHPCNCTHVKNFSGKPKKKGYWAQVESVEEAQAKFSSEYPNYDEVLHDRCKER